MVRRATARSGLERRSSTRIEVLIDVLVDPRCDGTYLFARATSVSADGLFVRCAEPEPVGTALRLRIVDDDDTTIELEGEVAWRNPAGLGAIDPGMGVRFVGASTAARRRLMALIGRIAYLDEAVPAQAE
ncbi:MAG: PilZ domain-containing protein [Myxococcales bacterium]|nr:PilZ domain-containing protein [Myxococcales bacterium]